MGAGNVKAVYGLWGDLPDAAFRLLIYMATIAMDEDDPPRFYGGRETMAYALGWVVEDRKTVDPAEISKRERAFKSVHRLVCVLKKAGAITTLVAAAPGRTAEYALNLKVNRSLKNWDRSRPRSQKKGDHSEPAEAAPEAQRDGNGPKSFDVTVPNESAERSPFSRRTVPSERGPQEEKEQERTTGEEEMAEVSPTAHPPRATADDSNPAPKKCPEHGLGGGLRPDGKPECTLCRVVGPKPSDPDPDPPPDRPSRCDHTPLPGKDRCRICAPKPIAPVIRIDTRRPA